MTNNEKKQPDDWLSRGNHRLVAIVLGVGVLAASAVAVQAFAQSKTYQHYALHTSEEARSDDGSLQLAGWRSHRRGGWSDLSNAEIEERITRVVKHAAIEIDATPEQQEQIIGILTPVAINMKSMRGEMRGTGFEFFELLTESSVDRWRSRRCGPKNLLKWMRSAKNGSPPSPMSPWC